MKSPSGRSETPPVPQRLALASRVFLLFCLLVPLACLLYGLVVYADHPDWSRIVIAASVATAGLLTWVLFCRAEIRAIVSLVIVTVLACSFLANTVLIWINHHNVGLVEWIGQPGFDRRDKYQVVQDLREKGEAAFPSVPPAAFLDGQEAALFPVSGIANVTTVYCNEIGAYTIYRADRYGFNNDDGVYDDRRQRLLVTGDSFAQGACVPPGRDVAGQLRASGYAAISLGMDDNGPLIELASLIEYGAPLRPSKVLWLYYDENDLTNLRDESKSALLGRYLSPGFSQDLIDRQDEIDAACKTLIRRLESDIEVVRQRTAKNDFRVQFWDLIKNVVTLGQLRRVLGLWRAQHDDEAGDQGASLKRLAAILDRAASATRSWGGDFALVYLPGYTDFAFRPSPRRQAVLAIAADLGIPVIDFETTLRASGDPLQYFVFRGHRHYTEEGYALLAEQIRRELAR